MNVIGSEFDKLYEKEKEKQVSKTKVIQDLFFDILKEIRET